MSNKITLKIEPAAEGDLIEIKKKLDNLGELAEADLNEYAKKTDIPAAPDLSHYVTETDLEDALGTLDLSGKQDKLTETQLANINADHGKYLTEHQSLAEYARKIEIPDISQKQDVIADLEQIRSNAALGATALQTHQDISGKQDKLTEAQLANIDDDHSKYLTEHQSLAEYAKLTDIPDTSGFLTEHQSLANYALKSEIPNVPSTVSELTNDAGFITSADLPDTSNLATKDDLLTAGKVKTVNNTEPDDNGNVAIPIPDPDLTAYYTKTETDGKIEENKLTISNVDGNLTIGGIVVANITPLTEAQIANLNADHSQYLTEHQSLENYATKSEIPDVSGFLTEHQDISGKANSSDVYTKTEIDSKGYQTSGDVATAIQTALNGIGIAENNAY